MQDHRRGTDAGIGSVLPTSLLLVALTLGAAAVIHQAVASHPVPGDMIVFAPGTPRRADAVVSDVVAIVADASATSRSLVTCTLHMQAMLAGGGSLVVEAYDPQRSIAYRVHWAAGTDTAGCGRSADLLLSRDDLASLAAAAGGLGIAHDEQRFDPGPQASMDGNRQSAATGVP